MKNFKLLLLACVAVFATSCGGDDDGPGFEFNQENLEGTYSITFLETEESETFTLNSTTVTEVTITEGKTFTNATISFNANNTYVVTGSYVVDEVTRVDGQVTFQDEYIEDLDDAGTYSVNESSNTISLDNGSTVVSVTRFRESGFRIIEEEQTGSTSFMSEIRVTRQ